MESYENMASELSYQQNTPKLEHTTTNTHYSDRKQKGGQFAKGGYYCHDQLTISSN